ncbi:MAG: VCBS repeat-containing protein [Bacteroidota bacterium]
MSISAACSLSCLLLFFFSGCDKEASQEAPLFELLSQESTGVDFVNQLTDTRTFNILNYLYYYNGGGVAVGDVNNDDLPDLYFTGNMVSNKLYLNKGNLQFEDATVAAGVGGPVENSWATGVTMVDINADGWLDIYVNYLGKYLDKEGHNLLYVNNQDGTFSEQSAAFGLDLVGFSTQSYFFDYDRDGDLDLFQLNHSIDPARTVGDVEQRKVKDTLSGDRLLRNEEGKFVDVTDKAGIFSSKLGYGLSAAVGDIDMDGWPDVYVCNDFHEDDYLYINQGNGTFTEALRSHIGHTSRFSMGSDLADINNDGLLDLITLDMKPDREDILKTAEAPESYRIFQYKLSFGYYHQYPHNAVQLNRGAGKFSEIAQLLGVDATDWSWSALFADFDNDGYKDLHITNGIYRRPNDMDYIKFISDPEVTRKLNDEPTDEDLQFIEQMPQVKIPNYIFRGNRNNMFENLTVLWGLDQPFFSNGAIYSDLDRDGDLDLVVNHIQDVASIYENHQQDSLRNDAYLSIELEGPSQNPNGVGAKVKIFQGNHLQYYEHQPARGWQSSMEPGVLHIGLGGKTVDSLQVIWPDQKSGFLRSPSSNQKLILSYRESKNRRLYKKENLTTLLSSFQIPSLYFKHQEDPFVIFDNEPLAPHSWTNLGPRIAPGDYNQDGKDDFYFAQAKGGPKTAFFSTSSGRYRPSDLPAEDAKEEVDALMFHHKWTDPSVTQDEQAQSFLFRYKGPLCKFQIQGSDHPSILLYPDPQGMTNISPKKPFVKKWTGKQWVVDNAIWEDVGELPQTRVSDIIAADVNGDGAEDIVMVGEWMRPLIFIQENGKLKQWEVKGLEGSEGWWNRVHALDADGDGDMDLVAGNLGLNSTLKASQTEPIERYLFDFDGNGRKDPILTRYNDGVSYPFASKDELVKQMPSLRKKYERYSDYAQAQIQDIFPPEQLKKSEHLFVYQMASVYIEQVAPGVFEVQSLPVEAQYAPIFSIVHWDVNQDGKEDLILGGNFSAVGPNRGRYDASYGLILLGDGKGNWRPVPLEESGFVVEGEIRDMKIFERKGKEVLLVARNDDSLLFFHRQ